MKKAEPLKFIPVKCHNCDSIIEHALTRKYLHGRIIILCSQKCFVDYLNKNRPFVGADTMPAVMAFKRAAARLEKLKIDVLYTIPGSHHNHILEELIFELTYVIEGHESVTKDERYGAGEIGAPHPMEVLNERAKVRMPQMRASP